MSLFLTYRPKSFDEMVGQRHIIDILLAQTQKQDFSSSYLLYGPRWTWKTSTARLLAKVVNCTTFKDDGSPDLENDPAAKLIDAWKTLDFVEIDAASHTWVDNIREEIIDKALYPPTSLKMKVYVIDEVHMLSKGAFNALLKIMEEPRDYLMFVLATTEIHKVPDTIVSRCQVFNFKHHTIDHMTWRLKYIAEQEGIAYEEEWLRLIAKLSQWAMRDAIKYLEQISILWEITQENVASFLGVVADTVIADFLKTVMSGPFESVVAQLDDFTERWTDFSHLVKDILLYCNERFLDDPAMFSELSWVFQEIAAEAKWYPHPVLLRKRKLWNMRSPATPVSKPWSSSLPPKQSTPPKPQRSVAEPKKQEVEKQESSQQSDTKDTQSEVLPSTSGETQQSSWWEQAGQSTEGLLERIIEKVDKKMLKSVLMKHAHIRWLDNGVLSIIVINQQFYATVQKPEVVSYLQWIVSDILWTETVVKREYMSKDDFLAFQIGW